jgi:hypothetical protein
MSVLCLLRKISPKTPRFVTLDGQLVFGAAAVGSSYQHPSRGPVARVEPHHFHGGTSDDTVEAEALEPWWVEHPERVEEEVERMKSAFPGFELIDRTETLTWKGSIMQPPWKFDLLLSHRKDHSLPIGKVISPSRLGRPEGRRFVKPPHVYLSGNPCFASKDDWDANTHDMVTVVCWAAHWIAAYREWWMNGSWPTVGYEDN